MADRLDVEELDGGRIDTAFRALRDAPEPTGLSGSQSVRRRGDHRRLAMRAGAVVAVAVLAVGTVGVVEATRNIADRGDQQVPAVTPTPTEPPAALAAQPFLTTEDIPVIGPYSTFGMVGEVEPDEPFRADCLGDGVSPSEWAGAGALERRQLDSDLEASLQETVVLFDDEQAAIDATAKLQRECYSSLGTETFTTQDRALPGRDSSQRGVVSIPGGGGEIAYNEVAYVRDGRVLVVLDWASTGLPHGEDAESAQSWEWALPESLLSTALDRAAGRG